MPVTATAQAMAITAHGLPPRRCGQRVHFFFGGRRAAVGKDTNNPEAKQALSNKNPCEERKLGIRL